MKKMFDKWYGSEYNNVRTFNEIFKLSKIEGFDPEIEVTIGEMVIGGMREILVGDEPIRVELKNTFNKLVFNDQEEDMEFDNDQEEDIKFNMELEKIKAIPMAYHSSGNVDKVLLFLRLSNKPTRTMEIADGLGVSKHTVLSAINTLLKQNLVSTNGKRKNRLVSIV
jgi:hypothetical protein